MQQLEIQEQEVGTRLDRVLCNRLTLSRSQVKRLFEAGEVRRNGRRADKGELVSRGDRVELGAELRESNAQPDPSVLLDVRYEDDQLVIIDKAPGVPSHPLRPGELGCVANGLLARYPEMSGTGYDDRQPGLVNRLDNDTSGVLLCARSPTAFEALREALEAGQIHKRYLALCAEPVKPQSIELSLAPSPRHRARVEVNALGRPALSVVTSCRGHGELFIVEVRASRAYRHQVRAHLSAIGAPIVGDALYGGQFGARHYLHAASIELTHPFTGAQVEVQTEIPQDWPLERA
ncbi:MAG: Ribosomal large subunit pseudouridine synthase [Myxococcaceae bacterium]|nr:Ribosomal large subunit pseudouridine synthase [Myxococcaceae bacterium]